VKGLWILGLFLLLAVLAPWLTSYRPEQVFSGMSLLPPFFSAQGSWAHWLGTDDLGRDLWTRLIFGARVSIGLGFLIVFVSVAVGSFLGLMAGYFGGFVDRSVVRFVDVVMSLPSLLLAMVVVAILGPGLMNAVWAVSIVSLPGYIRIVRAAVMNEKSKDYVQATRSFGASHGHLIFKSIAPNCLAPLIVQATLGFSDAVLNMAALGFLGLGAQPPTPEWGVMLGDSRAYMESAWWLVTWPGLSLLVVVLTFNLVGDGLRDHLDPKLRGL
jgi:ABC-type dipeptide/oligopeptide/nickel transport system permease subunit